MILPPGRKSKHPAAGPKGGFELIFHIAVCSPDSVLRSRVERQCLDYYARRDDACIIEQLDSPEALLARDDAGERYELCRSVHAEANAITKVAKSANNCDGSTLYITAAPCIECSKLIIQAGIRRVVYSDDYRSEEGLDLLRRVGIECVQIPGEE